MLTDKILKRPIDISLAQTAPSIAKCPRRPCRAAVLVVEAANAEEGPLRDGPRVRGHTGSLGAQEVGLPQRRVSRFAGEDDEEEHHKRAREEEERQRRRIEAWKGLGVGN